MSAKLLRSHPRERSDGRVLADCHAGRTYVAIARKSTTSAAWVRVFHTRFHETGEIAARSHATNRTPFHARPEAALRAAVTEKPDRTLEDLRGRLYKIVLEGDAPGFQAVADQLLEGKWFSSRVHAASITAITVEVVPATAKK